MNILTFRWKCDKASPLYEISSAFAPFLISGKSDIVSLTVMVLKGAEVIRLMQELNWNDLEKSQPISS